MPFQILMAFHFLESRKRQSGAAFSWELRFSRIRNAGPGFRSSGSEPTRKLSLRGGHSDLEQWCCREGDSLRCPAPFPDPWAGGSPYFPRLTVEGGRAGIQGREETTPGLMLGQAGQPQMRENGASRTAPPLPNFVGGPGAGPGKGRAVSAAEPLGGDCRPFRTQPQAQAALGGLQDPDPTLLPTSGSPYSTQGAAPRSGGRERAGGCVLGVGRQGWGVQS